MKNGLTITLLAAGFAMGSPADAQEGGKSRLDEILTRGHLIVGTGSTNAPFHFVDESGKLTGFDVDVAKIIAKGLFNDETKVEFVDQSADARIPNIVTNKVDITCQFMTVTAARAQLVAFTIPYYREGAGLLLNKSGKYQSYEELKAAGTVAVSQLQNVFAEEWTHMVLPKATVDQYDSMDAAIQALDSGRSDAASVDASNVRWLVRQHPERYMDSGKYWVPNNYACAVARGDQVWLNWVNTALHEAITGVDFPLYAAAYKKWFAVDLPEPKIGAPN